MNIDLDKLKGFFSADRFAMEAGIVIDAADSGRVQCGMEIKDSHRNAGGNVQGGAIFTLADFTFGVHSNLAMFLGADVGLTVGQSCSISYLNSSKGTRLIAESACLHRGRTISVYRISISDDLGVPIAEMHGNGFTTAARTKRP
ncbi:MAG: PaaI family thioesterase [Spirochaetaceae bacterium]|nr:PaaI family thioesterase [Spirochaetaceae bacterium]